MSDLGALSDLSGKQGEESSKATGDNQQKERKSAQQNQKAAKESPKADEDTQAPSEPIADDERPKERKRRTRSPQGSAVTGEADDVLLSRTTFQSRESRKSLTVHHVQRRLLELEYFNVNADPDGWYSNGTAAAVRDFQRDQLIETDTPGQMDADTFEALFELDGNVRVVLDR